MSNEWNLLCRTCDVTCNFEWNHGGDRIQQLIPHMQLLADCAEKLEPAREILAYHVRWEIEFPWELVSFAKQHHSHDLTAIDEYGKLYGDCGTQYRCECCGTYLRCKKLADHDGDHGPKEAQP
ncbi:hypothetical protein LTT66_18155 [Nocardia gipuzkoensis]|uniref:hypothetical protein n=1 Tax=Nocardia gipuzkoensis TaxID=2749991 RepID=UPI001E3209CA|nr:hypothetical protein [Nocardia gipuzkoensis]UGT65293.1 hypothetical protein LTT66_18155 [Nocardia gipuzkoensis]